MTSRYILLLTIVALVFADDSIVQTSNGLVRGIVQDTFRVFKSIPFATPPVGALRWKSPKPAASWAPSVYDATKFRDSCVQNCILPDGLCGDSYSEDCLYLNVYTPRNVSVGQKLPVCICFCAIIFFRLWSSCLVVIWYKKKEILFFIDYGHIQLYPL